MPSNCEYYLYQKFIKYGTQDFIPVYPVEYAISGDSNQPPVVKRCESPNCGFCEPEYRWHTLPIGEEYICSGGNKYYKEVYQVSTNCGFNWENTSSARTGNLYEYDSEDCQHDYSQYYLTFIPISGSSTFTFSRNGVSYSLDSGNTWNTLASNTPSPTVNQGDKIMWKGELTASQTYPFGIGTFSSTGQFVVEGNIMSLLFEDNFAGEDDLTGKNNAFRYLFSGCTGVTSAENLILPATTLVDGCYGNMFQGCTNLTTAPELSATTLVNQCYNYMFQDCTSLTTAPELPATTLASWCYGNMFDGCTSLTVAPELPATTLVDGCYQSMFQGCTNLTTAPVLSATTLANYCYYRMFYGCTSLTVAPELPATTLVYGCYDYMFNGCTNLTSITCLATYVSSNYYTNNWVNGVAANGTFTKAASTTSWTIGNNGIPSGWSVQNYSS